MWRWLLLGGGSLLLVASLGLALGSWLVVEEEEAVLTILAARVPEIGLPVYAQFTVTQRLVVPQAARVSRLAVPMFLPESGRALTITLSNAAGEVGRWELLGIVGADRAGLGEVSLAWPEPQVLKGGYELHFAAAEIPVADRERAPRIFVEPADGAYPDGNYRIADNEKEGDVSVAVYERLPRWQRLADAWREDPLEAVEMVLVWLGLTGLLVALPMVLAGRRG